MTASTTFDPQAVPALTTFPDADALRRYLDDLNENGCHPIVVGWTAPPYPQAFLITLVGCYADGEDVLFDSPWQTDIQWANGREHCPECMGHVHGIGDLRYPVTVMAATAESAATELEGQR